MSLMRSGGGTWGARQGGGIGLSLHRWETEAQGNGEMTENRSVVPYIILACSILANPAASISPSCPKTEGGDPLLVTFSNTLG